jgi:hypothetical protein
MDYFEGEQQSVILTEYLGGGELFEHISSAHYELTEAKCRDFARQGWTLLISISAEKFSMSVYYCTIVDSI